MINSQSVSRNVDGGKHFKELLDHPGQLSNPEILTHAQEIEEAELEDTQKGVNNMSCGFDPIGHFQIFLCYEPV